MQQIVPLGIYLNRKIDIYHYKSQHYNLLLTSDQILGLEIEEFSSFKYKLVPNQNSH